MKTFALCFVLSVIGSQATAQVGAVANPSNEFPVYFKVQLERKINLSSLRAGDVAEGNLARDVYSSNGKVFAAGSHVRLSVDHVERKRKAANNDWPWVVKLFRPRHENSPIFSEATISAEGRESSLHVALISAAPEIDVRAQSAKKHSQSHPAGAPILSLEAHVPADQSMAAGSALPATPGSDTIPTGTVCRVLLLDELISSRNRTGDPVGARLLEPVVLESGFTVPAGSLFEGKITKAIPPRWLSRAGSLAVTFTSITQPDGSRQPITASIIGVELRRGSHTKLDAEGRLHGEKPGLAWMLINGGMTAGLAKEVDDGTQLVLEAIISSATDVSTAGTARIAGSIVSGIFMVTRHGRDVVLPDHTEMDILLNRPVTTPAESALSARVAR